MKLVAEKPFLNKKIMYYHELDSTNIEAQKLAKLGAAEGTVVVADRQTAGSGRLRRRWESPAGQGLWFSLLLRPTIAAADCAQLTLLSAVAVTQALRGLTGKNFTIKWPNDIMLDGKKICGILAEMELAADGSVEYAVVGIGINIKMAAEDFGIRLAATATSLYLATGIVYEREQVLKAFWNEFVQLYSHWQQHGFAFIRQNWLEYNCTLGHRVVIKDNDEEIYSGTAEAMDDYGSLLVRNAAGESISFNFGEISIRSCSG